MNLKIFFPGKIKDSNIKSLADYYTTLASKYGKVEIISITDKSEKKLGLNILGKHMLSGFNVILSEAGREFSTVSFAKRFEELKMNHSQINFFIGNAFGFEDEVKQKANLILSLSQMTTSHEFALIFLLEQLFRIMNLNAGGQYHK